jgi:hypothetical protein
MRRRICGYPHRGNLEFEGRTQQDMARDAIDRQLSVHRLGEPLDHPSPADHAVPACRPSSSWRRRCLRKPLGQDPRILAA